MGPYGIAVHQVGGYTYKEILVKTKRTMMALSATAIAMLLAACGGAQPAVSEDPKAGEVTEVQSTEVVEVEKVESPQSEDADADAIDFEAINEAQADLWSLTNRAEEAQGATRESLLVAVEDSLNSLTDSVLDAMDRSVANLDFDQIGEANGAAWSLINRAEDAQALIDVTPVLERIIAGLDQAGATLVSTAGSADAAETNGALWSLNNRVEDAQEIINSSANQ